MKQLDLSNSDCSSAKKTKKKKPKTKDIDEVNNLSDENNLNNNEELDIGHSKKKKRKRISSVDPNLSDSRSSLNIDDIENPTKEIQDEELVDPISKKKRTEINTCQTIDSIESFDSPKLENTTKKDKKKKKRKKENDLSENQLEKQMYDNIDPNTDLLDLPEISNKKEKKKKRKNKESNLPESSSENPDFPGAEALTNAQTSPLVDKKKKKKVQEVHDNEAQINNDLSKSSDSSIPKDAIPHKTGRPYTISIAVPASILEETCPLHEMQTYVVGQVARAACIYAVDEIIVFNDHCWRKPFNAERFIEMMSTILMYQECPPYLRKEIFPYQDSLKNAALLNPLNAPHHLKTHEWCNYREGIVQEKQFGNYSSVYAGFRNCIQIDKKLKPGVRVTLKFPPEAEVMNKPYGNVVSPEEPRTNEGLYWGYTVRVANSLTEVFKSDRFKNGYDLVIATSDKGDDAYHTEFPKYQHALIVFGAVDGLEASLQADESTSESNPRKMFQHYLNTCPQQKSRTIRTEEAILISLSVLKPKLDNSGCSL